RAARLGAGAPAPPPLVPRTEPPSPASDESTGFAFGGPSEPVGFALDAGPDLAFAAPPLAEPAPIPAPPPPPPTTAELPALGAPEPQPAPPFPPPPITASLPAPSGPEIQIGPPEAQNDVEDS